MNAMKDESLRDALLRGDCQAVARIVQAGAPELLENEKNALLRELSDAHLRGDLPFCQLTAAAQAACAFPLKNGPFVACCGGVAGNTSAIGKNYMMMLLRAWGIPALDLGMDVPAEAFLKAIRAHSLGYAVCVGFSAGDANFIRGLHRLAAEHGIRARFRLLLCGASLTPETLAALPLDLPDNRAAAVAEWMVDTWTK